MWNRILGKPNDAEDNSSPQSSRRTENEQRSTRKRSDSIASSSQTQKSKRGDDRDRGFHPTSTSYSSTTRNTHPDTASASIASSYATASGNQNGEPYLPPGLVRNASLADQMPKSKTERDDRDPVDDRERKRERRKQRTSSLERERDREDNRASPDREEKKREKKERRKRRGEDAVMDRGLEGPLNGHDATTERTRGDFHSQIAEPGFAQFPGQTSAGFVGGPPSTSAPMSDHVPDQFPNQFPTNSTAPYRPPLAASEGGPGLAAEYYGDAGESVAEQPGVRPQTPSLIVGSEPHLQPASSTAAPPPEPSASGHVGAAASFFSGSFESDTDQPSHKPSSQKPIAPSSPKYSTQAGKTYYTTSSTATPALNTAAAGAAAGYYMSSQSSSHPQRPDHASSVGGGGSYTSQRPNSHGNGSYSQPSNYDQPPKPGKQNSFSSDAPLYAAGAAGLAAAGYHHNHHSNTHQSTSSQLYVNGLMAQRHHHRGPLAKFVDFFKDPEGVAQFEEYTEYIGVCKDCFAPGSSPREAPRKHHQRARRSGDRFGSSTRVDKDSRYSSSDSERRRRRRKSWLEAGVAGYGLSKVGENLFNQNHDFDDTHSVKTGYTRKSHTASSPDRRIDNSHGATRRSSKTMSRRRSSSTERFETGVTSDGRLYKKNSHGDIVESVSVRKSSARHRSKSRSRSRSRDRKAGLGEVALGVALGSSIIASDTRHTDHPPEKVFVRRSRSHRERSPERQRAPHKKEKRNKKKGFFSFRSSSSSSSGEDLTLGGKRKNRKRRDSKDDHRKAELAVAGLGAAAAALALNETRQNNQSRRKSDLVAVKEPKARHGRGPEHRKRNKPSPSRSEEDPWESASDGDESINSDLAYGDSVRRRRSNNSLSSESSGTSKWRWRWGSKRKTPRADKQERHGSPDDRHPGITMHSNSSLPLQQMYPVPTADPSRYDSRPITDSPYPSTTARPDPVPIQHPQPIAPVSQSVYSTQAPPEHAYSAPTGSPVFSHSSYRNHPSATAPYDSAFDVSSPYHIPGAFHENAASASGPFDGPPKASKSRRRDSSPAAYFAGPSQSAIPRRQGSLRDASSAVRFDLTEEQLEKDRRHKRRQAREDDTERKNREERKERNEAEALEYPERDSRAHKERARRSTERKASLEDGSIIDSREDGHSVIPASDVKTSWVLPIAAVGVASVVGAAIKAQHSSSDSSSDEKARRRERRRRRQAEREAAAEKTEVLPEQYRREESEPSVWKDLTKNKRTQSHEDYRDFFVPVELLSRAPGYKEEAADADADHVISVREVPDSATREPSASVFYDTREKPAYTFGPNGEELNPYPPSPSWVPKLKLVSPTPQPNSFTESERGDWSPIIASSNAVEGEDAEIASPITTYEVRMVDEQTPEYTVIEPKEHHDEVVESPPNGVHRNRPSSTSSRDGVSSDHLPRIDDRSEANATGDYGDDLVFAATVAAGLQDAGFDPSVVVDDPSFRRRDSPPGSEEPGTYRGRFVPSILDLSSELPKDEIDVPPQQGFVEGELPESSMPGAFVDEEVPDQPEESEQKMSKREKKKKDKKSKRSELVETPEQPSAGVIEEKSRDVKSEPDFAEPGPQASIWEMQEDPGDAPSVAASAPAYTDAAGGKKSKKKGKRGSLRFKDEESVVSAPVTREELDRPTFDAREAGQDRLTGLDRISDPDALVEGAFEEVKEKKKKGKKSKGRRSVREAEDISPAEISREFDDRDIVKEPEPKANGKSRRSSDVGSLKDSGRITQDLPAKVSTPAPIGHAPSSPTDRSLTNPEDRDDAPVTDANANTFHPEPPLGRVERDQSDDAQTTSFLGIGQEISPSPDISVPIEALKIKLPDSRPSSPSTTEPDHDSASGVVSLSTSPTRQTDAQAQRLSELQKSGNTQSPLSTPSPTAIPFHFRIPPASPGVARPSPSAPPTPSAQDAYPSRPKLRPRSTEFKSSSEFRPLWLVERHASKQEPSPGEAYPSLPSSHTTSRTSSVRDPDETASDRAEFFDTSEYYLEDNGGDYNVLIDTARASTEAGFLDSQQTTPTAATFPNSSIERHESPKQATDEGPASAPLDYTSEVGQIEEAAFNHDGSSSLRKSVIKRGSSRSLKDVTLGAVLGASVTGSLLAAKYKDDNSREFEDDEPGVRTREVEDNASSEMEEKQGTGAIYNTCQDADDFMGASKVDQSEENNSHDPTPNPSHTLEKQSFSQALESLMSPGSTGVKPLTVEQQRAIQEEDAQDAVDTWFSPESSGKSKIDKAGKFGKKKRRSLGRRTESKDASLPDTPLGQRDDEMKTSAAEASALQEAIDVRSRKEEPIAPTPEVSKALSKEMPVEEVVNVMSNVAENTQGEIDDLPSTPPKPSALATRDRLTTSTRNKGRSGKKSRKACLIPGQGTFNESVMQVDDKTAVDRNIAETLGSGPKEATALTADDSLRDVTESQDPKALGSSSVPLEPADEEFDYAYSVKKSKKGKKKSKRGSEPQIDTKAMPESDPVANGNAQFREAEVEDAGQGYRPDGQSNSNQDWTSKTGELVSPELIPLPIEEDPEFLDAVPLDLTQNSPSAMNYQMECEPSGPDRPKSDAVDALRLENPSDGPQRELKTLPADSIQNEEVTLQESSDIGDSSFSEPKQPAISSDKDADDLLAFPVKKGKKSKKSKQEFVAGIDVAAEPEASEPMPITAILRPADSLKDLKPEPKSTLEERLLDEKPDADKDDWAKKVQQEQAVVDSQPTDTTRESQRPVTIEPPTQIVNPEIELVRPDEIELPPSEGQPDGLSDGLSDGLDVLDIETQPIVSDLQQDDVAPPFPELQETETDLSLPEVYETENIEVSKLEDDQSDKSVIPEPRELPNGALQGTPTDLSNSNPPEESVFRDVGIHEASKGPNEAFPASNDTVAGEGIWDLPSKKKKGKKSNKNKAEAIIPAPIPSETDEVSAAPAIPAATTDAADAVKDMLDSASMEEFGDSANVDQGLTGTDVDLAKTVMPAISEQPLEADEWKEDPKGKSKKAKKNRKAKLRDVDASEELHPVQADEEPNSLSASTVATTDTAQGIRDILESEGKPEVSQVQDQQAEPAPTPIIEQPSERAAEIDQTEWEAPKKKKGKKGKKGRSVAAEDATQEEVMDLPPAPPMNEPVQADAVFEPMEEFTTKKSKKDKKGKKKHSILTDTSPPEAAMFKMHPNPDREFVEDSTGHLDESGAVVALGGIASTVDREEEQVPADDGFRESPALSTGHTTSALGEEIALNNQVKLNPVPEKGVEYRSQHIELDDLRATTEPSVEEVALETPRKSWDVPQTGLVVDEPIVELGKDPSIAETTGEDIQTWASAKEPHQQPVTEDLPSSPPSDDLDGPGLETAIVHDGTEILTQSGEDNGEGNVTKAPEQNDDTTTLTLAESNPQIVSESLQELIAEPADLANIALAEADETDFQSVARRKKDRKDTKLGKKTSFASWEDEFTPPEPQETTAAAGNPSAEDDDAPTQDVAEEPLQSLTEALANTPKIKKDKKKAKKAKSLTWEDDVDTTVPESNESIIPAEETIEQPAKVATDDFEDVREGKKGKRKGKKAQPLPFEDNAENATLSGERDVESGAQEPDLSSVSEIDDARVESEQPIQLGAEDLTGDSQKAVDEQGKPAESRAIFERNNAGFNAQEIDRPTTHEELGVIEEPNANREAVNELPTDSNDFFETATKSKKDKTKAKKAKALSWADELVVDSLDVDEEAQGEPKESTATTSSEPPLQERSAQPFSGPATQAAEGFESVPKSKKDRKKGKKSKSISWADEPENTAFGTDDMIEAEPREQLDASEQDGLLGKVSAEPMKDTSIADDPVSATQSRKAKKKSKKSKTFEWTDDSEPTQSPFKSLEQPVSESDRISTSDLPDQLNTVYEQVDTAVALDEPIVETVEYLEDAEVFQQPLPKGGPASPEARSLDQPASETEKTTKEPKTSDGFVLEEAVPDKASEAARQSLPESQDSSAGDQAVESPLSAPRELSFVSTDAEKSTDRSERETIVKPAELSVDSAPAGEHSAEASEVAKERSIPDSISPSKNVLHESERVGITVFEPLVPEAEFKPVPDFEFQEGDTLKENKSEALDSQGETVTDASNPKLVQDSSISATPEPTKLVAAESSTLFDNAKPRLDKEETAKEVDDLGPSADVSYSLKKSKKDKKKNNKAKAVELGEEPTQFESPSASLEAQQTFERSVPSDQVIEEALKSNVPLAEQAMEDDALAEPFEPEPSFDTPYSLKKSKKDKKKAKKPNTADIELENPPSESPSTFPQSQQVVDASTPLAPTIDQPSSSAAPLVEQNIDGGVATETTPPAQTMDEPSPSATPLAEQRIEDEVATQTIEPEPEPEVDASYSLKKSKKDKKKAKKAKVLDVEEEIAQSAPQVVEETVEVQQGSEEPKTTQMPDRIQTPPTGMPSSPVANDNYPSKAPLEKVASSTSPEQAHKRGFFEDIGPEVPAGEEELMEPPSKTKRTDESDPPSQKMMEMEEEAFSMPVKKSKKGKKSEKSASSDRDLDQREPTILQEDVPPSQPFVGVDKDSSVREQLGHGEPDVQKSVSEALGQENSPVPTETTIQDLNAPEQDTENTTEAAGDDFWDMPAKKGKKEKKKRKSAVRIKSDPEIVEAETPVAATPVNELTPTLPVIEESTSAGQLSGFERQVEGPNTGVPESKAFFGQVLPEDKTNATTEAPIDVENGSASRRASQEPITLGDEAIPLRAERLAEGPLIESNEGAAAFETPKTSQKAKKGKKRQQSIAWEDDTATAPGIEQPVQPADGIAQPISQPDPEVLEETATFEASKKSKKDKKAKKRQQSVAWEDDSATAPGLDKLDQLDDDIVQPVSRPISKIMEDDPGEGPPPDPLSNERTVGDDLETTPRMDEYAASGLRLPRPLNHSDDYFSIPTREEEPNIVKPFSPSEPASKQANYGPATQAYAEEFKREIYEQGPAHSSSKPQEPVPRFDDLGYEEGYATFSRQERADLYNTKSQPDNLEMTSEEATVPVTPIEAAEGPAPTGKAKKDKKSKKRRTAGEIADPIQGNWPEENTGQYESWPRNMSPARPLNIEEEGMNNQRDANALKALALGGTLGAGAAVAESLARQGSKKRGKKDEKSRKSANEVDDVSTPVTPYEELRSFDDGQERFDTRPTTSPVAQGRNLENTRAQDEDPLPERSNNRDSAVHVSDSPIVSENVPVHRPLRDSGYPDTDTSPVIDLGREDPAGAAAQEADLADPLYETATREHRTRAEDDSLSGRREPYTDADALNISMDGDADPHDNFGPGYEPQQEQQQSRRRPTPEIGLPKGLDTMCSAHNDLREPSPVSSTTKDRSSTLFQSSPSSREVAPDPDAASQSPPHAQQFPEHGRALSPRSPSSPSPAARQQPHESLFGGPLPQDTMLSPPMSPNGRSYSPRPGLDTIKEYSPEESPLHKRDRRSLSDVGSPDRGVKSRRRTGSSQGPFRSPPPAERRANDMLSTDDIISRLSWPEVDEEKHSVDLERSRSRTREASGRQSVVSPAGPPPAPAEGEYRSFSGASIRSGESINAIIRTPPGSVRSSGTPPLRRTDRSVSSDLREANRASHAKNAKNTKRRASDFSELGPAVATSSKEPSIEKGKGKASDMADVFEGYGDANTAGSPRPQSMRKRHSMHILDLETRLDQLLSENRILKDANTRADRTLDDAAQDSKKQNNALREAIETRDLYLRQKDDELRELRQILEGLQSQVSQLTEVNQSLSDTRDLADEHEHRYGQLEADHAETHQQWQDSQRELDELRQQHSNLSGGMENIVRQEISAAMEGRNAELRQVRDELEAAKEQVRALQRQILESRSKEDFIIDRDEDYFDTQCQKLCQHVQQWVLRFSKFSDMKACFAAREIMDEKFVDRMENAILDGSDVDDYLQDRVKRRDVFMSVVMSMVFEYIFTRYLFGMDREQRQKLKTLEKSLSEVGPQPAVHKWRATTLTLLAQRPAFLAQREQDTEAVVHEIYTTLATFLPPPGHLQQQTIDSLRKVIASAVDLSIEMRTQRAEYMMLPPLQPEYDTNGDLAQKVFFNASVMNERSGATVSNEALQAQQAVVRMVLFPLVVKKGDETGVGEEQIVVCPAQVLTAPVGRERKSVRVMSAEPSVRSDAGMGGMI